AHRTSYSESLINLPYCYQPNDNSRPIARTKWTRAKANLPEQGFVFCCFNNSYKIAPPEFEIWMNLLERVAGSTLWLMAASGPATANLLAAAAKRGVDPDRLVFASHLPLAEHLARLRLADLFLDTFNYNAHTTASDALWAGLPVLTKLGEGFAARVAASLLHAVGLDELVTTSEQGYANLAFDLATDPARLAAIRDKLAANRGTSALFDSESFTRHIETGFEAAYQRYLTGASPGDIFVPDQASSDQAQPG
ncbi:MAG TPA: hypothetical protein VGR05_08980, partial [Sphingomicrobium sp.]|nr:hypothetical protein [Sphingomicrobium sp.]